MARLATKNLAAVLASAAMLAVGPFGGVAFAVLRRRLTPSWCSGTTSTRSSTATRTS